MAAGSAAIGEVAEGRFFLSQSRHDLGRRPPIHRASLQRLTCNTIARMYKIGRATTTKSVTKIAAVAAVVS